MRRRAVRASALAAALMVGACGGASGGPSPGPSSTVSRSSSTSSPPRVPAAVGLFRACHKNPEGFVVLVLKFENRDTSLIGGFQGEVAFDVSAVSPATWTTTDEAVPVALGFHEHIRRIRVPAGEPVPSELRFAVTTTEAADPSNVLATNDVTIPVPATSCSTA